MKSFFKYLCIAILAITLIPVSSCKKGANDPFSLRSRAARLEGTWKLTTQTYTVTEVQGNTKTTRDYTYDGVNVTIVTVQKIGNANPVTNTIKYPYTETWIYTKDNTFTCAITQSGAAQALEGNWAFLGADEGADLKKKEAFVRHITKNTIGSSIGTAGKTDNAQTIVLDKLANTDMSEIIDESDIQSATDSKIVTGSRTFKQ